MVGSSKFNPTDLGNWFVIKSGESKGWNVDAPVFTPSGKQQTPLPPESTEKSSIITDVTEQQRPPGIVGRPPPVTRTVVVPPAAKALVGQLLFAGRPGATRNQKSRGVGRRRIGEAPNLENFLRYRQEAIHLRLSLPEQWRSAMAAYEIVRLWLTGEPSGVELVQDMSRIEDENKIDPSIRQVMNWGSDRHGVASVVPESITLMGEAGILDKSFALWAVNRQTCPKVRGRTKEGNKGRRERKCDAESPSSNFPRGTMRLCEEAVVTIPERCSGRPSRFRGRVSAPVDEMRRVINVIFNKEPRSNGSKDVSFDVGKYGGMPSSKRKVQSGDTFVKVITEVMKHRGVGVTRAEADAVLVEVLGNYLAESPHYSERYFEFAKLVVTALNLVDYQVPLTLFQAEEAVRKMKDSIPGMELKSFEDVWAVLSESGNVSERKFEGVNSFRRDSSSKSFSDGMSYSLRKLGSSTESLLSLSLSQSKEKITLEEGGRVPLNSADLLTQSGGESFEVRLEVAAKRLSSKDWESYYRPSCSEKEMLKTSRVIYEHHSSFLKRVGGAGSVEGVETKWRRQNDKKRNSNTVIKSTTINGDVKINGTCVEPALLKSRHRSLPTMEETIPLASFPYNCRCQEFKYSGRLMGRLSCFGCLNEHVIKSAPGGDELSGITDMLSKSRFGNGIIALMRSRCFRTWKGLDIVDDYLSQAAPDDEHANTVRTARRNFNFFGVTCMVNQRLIRHTILENMLMLAAGPRATKAGQLKGRSYGAKTRMANVKDIVLDMKLLLKNTEFEDESVYRRLVCQVGIGLAHIVRSLSVYGPSHVGIDKASDYMEQLNILCQRLAVRLRAMGEGGRDEERSRVFAASCITETVLDEWERHTQPLTSIDPIVSVRFVRKRLLELDFDTL